MSPIRRSKRAAGMVILCALSNLACLFPETVNDPLRHYEPNQGYRFSNLDLGPNNSNKTFVCLTLSGGGTRAAALAYGVMLGLREAKLTFPPRRPGGPQPTLLDELDVISSVSGGSFAAMGYGVWRDRFFDGVFRDRFLDLNLETELLRVLLNPVNAIRLPSVVLDRIDVAAKYYDKRIFNGAEYADLIRRNRRPFIVVNATNLAISERVEFTQRDFDILGSDLASVPAGWAVAASSAFPVVFSPLRLAYHRPPPGLTAIHDYATVADAAPVEPRLRKWARHVATREPVGPDGRYELDLPRHRYLYLADGGLVDNLGLSHVIESHQRGDIRRLLDAGAIERFIVIAVDAGGDDRIEIEQFPAAPGILLQTYMAASIGVENYSQALLRIMNHLMTEEPRLHAEAAAAVRNACPEAADDFRRHRPRVERTFIHIGFHLIEDRAERARFERIPTRLYLPRQQVDDLIKLGHDLTLAEIKKH